MAIASGSIIQFGTKMTNLISEDMSHSEETRRCYEPPVTQKVQVELEGSLCGSAAVTNPDDERQGRINAHKTNESFDVEGGSSSVNGWDVDVW